jgi:hypothetical protein
MSITLEDLQIENDRKIFLSNHVIYVDNQEQIVVNKKVGVCQLSEKNISLLQ